MTFHPLTPPACGPSPVCSTLNPIHCGGWTWAECPSGSRADRIENNILWRPGSSLGGTGCFVVTGFAVLSIAVFVSMVWSSNLFCSEFIFSFLLHCVCPFFLMYCCIGTVGSLLFAPRLSVSGHSDVRSRRHFFSVTAEKLRCGHWSFATGERKAAA